jgi:preprotein translocase subunit SecY
LIFASALCSSRQSWLAFSSSRKPPGCADAASAVQAFFNATGVNSWGYWLLYFVMVVAFTYFYTTVIFEQQNYGDNLKRSGAQIPGVHAGAATQKYLSRIQSRITLPGALLLGTVAIMPFLLQIVLPLRRQRRAVPGLILGLADRCRCRT